MRRHVRRRSRVAGRSACESSSSAPAPRASTMTVRDDMLNGHDICHGGFITTLADSAFAFACNSRNELTVAAGLTVDFLAPAQRGDVLTAEAREVTRAGRTGVYDIVVTNQRGAARRAGPWSLAARLGERSRDRRRRRSERRDDVAPAAARRARADRARQPRRAARAPARAPALDAAARLRQRSALPARVRRQRACIRAT